MGKITKIVIGIAVVVVVVALGAWGVYNMQPSDSKVKIGVITALTGSGAGTYGEPLKKGIDLALAHLDPDHTRYDVMYEDYQLDTKNALPAYNKLKSEGVKIFVIDGSPALNVITPEIRKEGFLSFNPGSFVPSYKDGNPLTCRIAITTDNYGPAYADVLINTLHINKVVMLTPVHDASTALIASFKEAYGKLGGSVVGEETYLKDATDFRTNITKLKSYTDADGIIAVNWFSSAPTMFKQMGELGLSKQVLTDDWTVAPVAKSLLEGAYVFGYNFSFSDPSNEAGKSFFSKYDAAYGGRPAGNAVQGYDVMHILDKAVVALNSSKPKDIGNYLVSKLGTYHGAGGDIMFNSDCEAQRDVTITHVVNGQVMLVK